MVQSPFFMVIWKSEYNLCLLQPHPPLPQFCFCFWLGFVSATFKSLEDIICTNLVFKKKNLKHEVESGKPGSKENYRSPFKITLYEVFFNFLLTIHFGESWPAVLERNTLCYIICLLFSYS